MAIKTKTQLAADINADITTNGAGGITGAILNDIMIDMVDSLGSLIQSYTSVERDAISTPAAGTLIYNSTTSRLEIYAGGWQPVGLQYQGAISCSANPNFPASKVGDVLRVSASGLIGGASGLPVLSGDLIICIESTAAGDYATNKAKFIVIRSGSFAVQTDKTMTTFGTPIVRQSNATTDANPLLYSTGSEFTLMFPEADLTATGTASILFPTGYRFFIESCGIIVTEVVSMGSQPHFSFGVDGSTAVYKASAATTGLAAAGDRNNYTSLLTVNGKTSVAYEIHTASNSTTLKGRVYFKGFLVENE
jgi:hypothetical protein